MDAGMKNRITFKNLKNNLHINSLSESDMLEKSTPDFELQINLIDIIKLGLSNKKFIASFVIVFMVMTAAVVYILPNKYTSAASILPSGNSDKYSAIKQIAGIGLGAFEADENSSMFFPTILMSNEVIDAVLDEKYSYKDNSKKTTRTFQDYLKITNRDLARNKLRQQLDISTTKNTGVITLEIETKYPDLSRAVLTKFLGELDRFNIYKRSSTAKNNVSYLKRELAHQEQELNKAEDGLESFQLVNRNWAATTNPELLKAMSRHKRNVQAKLNTYIFLRDQYEISKLDVQKDIPIVRILDQPSLATIKSSPRRLSTVLLSGMVAFFLSMFIMIAVDAYRKSSLYQYSLPSKIKQRNKSISQEVKI